MSALADLTLAAWALLEVAVRVREAVRGKGGRERDRATRTAIALTLGAAIAGALAARSAVPSLRMPAAAQVAGIAVMWLGLGVRVWAVAALGAAFRTTVEVDPGQAVVTRGPYRWVRHPSYTGLLLIVVGFSLAAGNWLSPVAALLVIPAFIRRIHVEEAELERVLGDAYRRYEAGTARLVPGIW
jgi:protein-S-isoprenylcysteine O-methyltransferase Ste14